MTECTMTDSELIAEISNRYYANRYDFSKALYKEANLIAFVVAHYYDDDDCADGEEGEKVYDAEGMADDIAELLNEFTDESFSVSMGVN